MLKHNNNSILTVNDTKRSSFILFQNEIRSKTIFLELTRKSCKKTRMPSKKRVHNLYDILSAYKSRDCISPNMSAICWNLEVLHCATTAQWKHNFTSRSLSYTIYLETALLNIFGQKSVIENMADCDVKRVTGPYFFRMIADQ